MQLTRLIYASKHDGACDETIDRILQTSRANNVRWGLTGALVVSEHHFLQLLEGDRPAVAECFKRIMLDKRHHDIHLIISGDVVCRTFRAWSMHRIETSRIKAQLLARYTRNGAFDPLRMSQVAIEDMCRVLSNGDWDSLAA